MRLLCTTRSDKLETPAPQKTKARHKVSFGCSMKGCMEAGIKTIVAAGKTPSNVINGGVTLVIPRRMYARPFHNETKLRAQKHSDFQTNDAGKKTWPQCSRVVFKTPNFTSIAAGSGQIQALFDSVVPVRFAQNTRKCTVDPNAYAFCVRGRLARVHALQTPVARATFHVRQSVHATWLDSAYMQT